MAALKIDTHSNIYRDLHVSDPSIPRSGDYMEYSETIAALNPTPQQMTTIRRLGRGDFHIALAENGTAVLIVHEEA